MSKTHGKFKINDGDTLSKAGGKFKINDGDTLSKTGGKFKIDDWDTLSETSGKFKTDQDRRGFWSFGFRYTLRYYKLTTLARGYTIYSMGLSVRVVNLGSDTFGNPIFQKVLQN